MIFTKSSLNRLSWIDWCNRFDIRPGFPGFVNFGFLIVSWWPSQPSQPTQPPPQTASMRFERIMKETNELQKMAEVTASWYGRYGKGLEISGDPECCFGEETVNPNPNFTMFQTGLMWKTFQLLWCWAWTGMELPRKWKRSGSNKPWRRSNRTAVPSKLGNHFQHILSVDALMGQYTDSVTWNKIHVGQNWAFHVHWPTTLLRDRYGTSRTGHIIMRINVRESSLVSVLQNDEAKFEHFGIYTDNRTFGTYWKLLVRSYEKWTRNFDGWNKALFTSAYLAHIGTV